MDAPPEGGAPLEGVRILDLSTMIAAPLTTSLLADLGADVVKVEHPVTGDHVRRFGTQWRGEGLYWKTLSRGKSDVALDLSQPHVQELIRRWVSSFDAVVENFRPGTLERWGIGPDVLREGAPRLVVLRVTAYGQDGPYSARPGFGTLAEAMSGVASVAPSADGRPVLPSYPLADVLAGHLGAVALLAALRRRDATSRGEVIDLAIYESALKLLELDIMATATGSVTGNGGDRYHATAPRGVYRCRDGLWIALSGSTQSVAMRVLRLVGGDAMVEDPRFRTNRDRLHNAEALDEVISDWCAARDREDAVREFSSVDCAVGPLETVATMMQNPQVVARRSLVQVDDPLLGRLTMTNVYPRFEEATCAVPEPGAAEIGRDTEDILAKDLGMSREAVAHYLAGRSS